jgi:hypothetical protein
MLLRHLPLTLALGLAGSLTAAAESFEAAFPKASFESAPLPAFVRVQAAKLPLNPGPWRELSGAEVGSSLAAYEAMDNLLVVPGSAPGRARTPAALGLQLPAGKPGATKPATADEDDDDDDSPTLHPGTFNQSSTKVPSAFLKTKTIAPHTGAPDVSYDVNDKTTIGLFGDLKNTSRTDTRAAISKPDRELGAGFTFQYKFGSH